MDTQFEPLADDPDVEEALLEEDEALDELSQEFVSRLVDKMLQFMEVLVGHPLHPYQVPFSRRIMESVIIGDGEEITALAARQSGKSEVIANTCSTLMVLLPRLAVIYPDLLGKFKDGFWIGLFAPTEGQAETLFGRTVSRLTSERAVEIMGDPEIDDIAARTVGVTKGIRLKKSGSTLMMMTANPRAKIESKSFHLVIVDECQEADDFVVTKSIAPMLAYYAGTMVKTGTPTTSKNNFYRSIQLNRRRQTSRGARQNHYQWDYKDVSKVNENYAKFIRKEILRIGEDSDEFQMCVAPDTRVLTDDLRHIPASDVTVGTRLVGFDEEPSAPGKHRQFQPAVVEAVSRPVLPSYRVTLSDGTQVTASEEHRWLVSTAGRRTVWKATKDLVLTDRLIKVSEVWQQDRSYEAAYLAGMFDGEGCLTIRPDGKISGTNMAQRPGLVLERTKKFLADRGFMFWESERNEARNGVHHLGIAGGRAEVMRFLGSVRPVRLVDKATSCAWGTVGRHSRDGFAHPTVVGLEYVGEIETVAFRTSTRTFIAEGLASHNSYNCKWLLERGMFVTSGTMDQLGDVSQEVVKSWFRSPVVVGIDPARKMDSTVVTVVWVDWDRPDEFGYFDHRVLNWLELQGDDWEEQYFQITNFLANYDVLAVGVDANGVGDAVAQRLKVLLPRAEVIPLTSSPSEQSKRWKHLQALIQRQMVGWPAHAKTRRLRTWRRFYQQMTDAEVKFSGPNFLVQAPDEAHAHDDYVDSLAIACSMTADLTLPSVEISENPFFR